MSLSTTLLWRGLLAIALGIVAVAWPGITVGIFVILFAIYAFIAAVMDATRAFGSRNAGPVAGYLLLALLSLAAGVAALVWPGITAFVLVIWIGAWALVSGVVEAATAFRRGESAGERSMWAITGLISIAFGVVLLIRPGIGALTLATVFGLFSIVYGVSTLIQSAQARKIGSTARQLADLPA